MQLTVSIANNRKWKSMIMGALSIRAGKRGKITSGLGITTNKGTIAEISRALGLGFLSPFEMYELMGRTNMEFPGAEHGEERCVT